MEMSVDIVTLLWLMLAVPYAVSALSKGRENAKSAAQQV